MLSKEQIDDLTIRGEIALVTYALTALNKHVINNHKIIQELASELDIWLKIPLDVLKSYTSAILYEKYAEPLLNEMGKNNDSALVDTFSLCFHMFLFAMHIMEGGEYLLYPDKVNEPTSDVIEEDSFSFSKYLSDCSVLLKNTSFDNELMNLYQTLIKTQQYTNDNVIGDPIL